MNEKEINNMNVCAHLVLFLQNRCIFEVGLDCAVKAVEPRTLKFAFPQESGRSWALLWFISDNDLSRRHRHISHSTTWSILRLQSTH
jgi:hypothetical protein